MSIEWKKFSLTDTPKISKLSPLYLRNVSNDPHILFHRCIQRPNIGQNAKLWKLLTSRFRKISGQIFFKWGPLPQMGRGSPFILKLLDTISESLLTGEKFWGLAPKNVGKCPLNCLNPKISKFGYMTP